MKILVTNDDGIFADGLWTLVRELKSIADVVVVAPDREQSAIGTAVTLRQPLRIQKIKSMVPEVETYSIDGTPSDSVILALEKLIKSRVDVVVSGINSSPNLGEDVHISGTVSAALQAYLRGFPAVAVSALNENEQCLNTAARITAILVKKMLAIPQGKIFLNVNVPDLPPAKVTGAKITRLARESHVNTVEESSHGRQKHYWLVRQKIGGATDDSTDVWALEQGNISVTPLYTTRSDKPPQHILNSLCADLFDEFKRI